MVGTLFLRRSLEETSSETLDANFDREHSSGGTRGQLVGGTVEGQLNETGFAGKEERWKAGTSDGRNVGPFEGLNIGLVGRP